MHRHAQSIALEGADCHDSHAPPPLRFFPGNQGRDIEINLNFLHIPIFQHTPMLYQKQENKKANERQSKLKLQNLHSSQVIRGARTPSPLLHNCACMYRRKDNTNDWWFLDIYIPCWRWGRQHSCMLWLLESGLKGSLTFGMHSPMAYSSGSFGCNWTATGCSDSILLAFLEERNLVRVVIMEPPHRKYV